MSSNFILQTLIISTAKKVLANHMRNVYNYAVALSKILRHSKERNIIMDNQVAPQRNNLLITGVLLIIASAIPLWTLFGNLGTMEDWLPAFGGEAMRGTWEFYYFSGIAYEFYAIVAGILTIFLSKNVSKSGVLQVLGCLGAVAVVILGIVYFVSGIYDYLPIISLLWVAGSLVLFLYLTVEATKNKAAANN